MFNFLKKQKEPQNLKEVLKDFEELKKKFKEISDELEEIKKDGKFSIQKTGVIRYNPFQGVGGDQSFSIALLDGNNSGMVITSIYSRDGSRVYAKQVKNNVSEHTLSEEEKKAISVAEIKN